MPYPTRRRRWYLAALLVAAPVVALAVDDAGPYYNIGPSGLPEFFGPPEGTDVWTNNARFYPGFPGPNVVVGTSRSTTGSFAAFTQVDASRDFCVVFPVGPGSAGSGIIAGHQFLQNADGPNSGQVEIDLFASATASGFDLTFGPFGGTQLTASVSTTVPCILLELKRIGQTLSARVTVDGQNFTDLGSVQIPPVSPVGGRVTEGHAQAVHGLTKDDSATFGALKIVGGDLAPKATELCAALEDAVDKLGKFVNENSAHHNAAALAALDGAIESLTTASDCVKTISFEFLSKRKSKGLKKVRTALATARNLRTAFVGGKVSELVAEVTSQKDAIAARDAAKTLTAADFAR